MVNPTPTNVSRACRASRPRPRLTPLFPAAAVADEEEAAAEPTMEKIKELYGERDMFLARLRPSCPSQQCPAFCPTRPFGAVAGL